MFFLITLLLLPIYVLKFFLNFQYENIKSKYRITHNDSKIVAFFHPFCNAGGGGERVLWSAIKILHQRYPQHCYVIYSDNYDATPNQIMNKAKETFQLDLDNLTIHFVKLRLCSLILAKFYPVLTLLGQNIGSMILGFEALLKCPPDIYIDTMGASFTYPIFRFIGFAKICTYTHYPIISMDMLNLVADNISSFNNRQFIARSPMLTKLKVIYYKIFSFLYRLAGKCAHIVMVNSTWTKNHIEQLWKRPVNIVYPPCNVDNLIKLNLDNKDPNTIISISQFRPEKNHELQLKSVAELIEKLQNNGCEQKPILIMVGSCRNKDDEERVQKLKKQCVDLKIQDYIQFKVNIAYQEMVQLMEKSSIALHTMTNEHFGISVVEFLAAGLLTLTHDSGGPKLDIIKCNETGFLANNCDEFAQQLFTLMTKPKNEALEIRIQARESIEKFSQEAFDRSFITHIAPLFQ